jgi:hypothetical protein
MRRVQRRQIRHGGALRQIQGTMPASGDDLQDPLPEAQRHAQPVDGGEVCLDALT